LALILEHQRPKVEVVGIQVVSISISKYSDLSKKISRGIPRRQRFLLPLAEHVRLANAKTKILAVMQGTRMLILIMSTESGVLPS
jgi:hypothetical protein